MATPIANITELDFQNSKTSILNYLKTNTNFTDYDFSGSGLNVLVDALAYATHYMALTANISFNELFLHSAVLRESVVRRAKELGYFPTQVQGAQATLNLSITNPAGSPATIDVPIYTEFAASIGGQNLSFVTTQPYTLTDDGNGVYAMDVAVAQGKHLSDRFTFNASTPAPFVLKQPNVDTNFLNVSVKTNSGFADSTAIAYKNVKDIFLTIDSTTLAYWLQERDERIEILFGDGVLGQALVDQNVILTDFLATEGPAANGAKVFSLISDIQGFASSLFTVTTVSNASGGAERQSIDSIRLNASDLFQSQNRAVTTNDYKALLSNQFGWIEAMNIWGGEDNVPPQFGKVFISLKPTYANAVTPADKASAVSFLTSLNVVSILPEIKDPLFTFIGVTSNVTYKQSLTNDLPATVQANVQTSIANFFAANLVAFEATLTYSKFVEAIDATDTAITGNLTSLTLNKTFVPLDGVTSSWTFDFQNVIMASSVSTQAWTQTSSGTTYQIVDDGLGKLFVKINGATDTTSIGTVDYTTGVVNIVGYTFNIDTNTTLTLTATPSSLDVSGKQDNLLRLLNNTSTVNVTAV